MNDLVLFSHEKLVELAIQLRARACSTNCTKEVHDRANAAQAEVLRRLESVEEPATDERWVCPGCGAHVEPSLARRHYDNCPSAEHSI